MDQSQPQEAWNEFLGLCLAIKDEKLLDEFLTYILTYEEKESLITRFLITRGLIQAKMTQREMASSMKVSIAKITRGSNALKTIPRSLREFLTDSFK